MDSDPDLKPYNFIGILVMSVLPHDLVKRRRVKVLDTCARSLNVDSTASVGCVDSLQVCKTALVAKSRLNMRKCHAELSFLRLHGHMR